MGWPGEAIILCGSLDLCCLQLDIGDCPADKSFTAIYSGGKGLTVNLLRKPCVGLKVYPKMSPYDNNERLAGLLISCYTY